MSEINKSFADFAQKCRNGLVGAAALATLPTFEVPGSLAENRLTSLATALLLAAGVMRTLECHALNSSDRSTTPDSE